MAAKEEKILWGAFQTKPKILKKNSICSLILAYLCYKDLFETENVLKQKQFDRAYKFSSSGKSSWLQFVRILSLKPHKVKLWL